MLNKLKKSDAIPSNWVCCIIAILIIIYGTLSTDIYIR